jgi:hypothetical protein
MLEKRRVVYFSRLNILKKMKNYGKEVGREN